MPHPDQSDDGGAMKPRKKKNNKGDQFDPLSDPKQKKGSAAPEMEN
jgi:hypothetical protein